MPTVVTDARVKYGEDFDVDACSPKSKALVRSANRQRRYREKKKLEQEQALESGR
jgi:hypothetical protein